MYIYRCRAGALRLQVPIWPTSKGFPSTAKGTAATIVQHLAVPVLVHPSVPLFSFIGTGIRNRHWYRYRHTPQVLLFASLVFALFPCFIYILYMPASHGFYETRARDARVAGHMVHILMDTTRQHKQPCMFVQRCCIRCAPFFSAIERGFEEGVARIFITHIHTQQAEKGPVDPGLVKPQEESLGSRSAGESIARARNRAE